MRIVVCVHIGIYRISTVPSHSRPPAALSNLATCARTDCNASKRYQVARSPRSATTPKGTPPPPPPRCNTTTLMAAARAMHHCLLARRDANTPMKCSPVTASLSARGTQSCATSMQHGKWMCVVTFVRGAVCPSTDKVQYHVSLDSRCWHWTIVQNVREYAKVACLFTQTMSSAPGKPPWGVPDRVSRTLQVGQRPAKSQIGQRRVPERHLPGTGVGGRAPASAACAIALAAADVAPPPPHGRSPPHRL